MHSPDPFVGQAPSGDTLSSPEHLALQGYLEYLREPLTRESRHQIKCLAIAAISAALCMASFAWRTDLLPDAVGPTELAPASIFAAIAIWMLRCFDESRRYQRHQEEKRELRIAAFIENSSVYDTESARKINELSNGNHSSEAQLYLFENRPRLRLVDRLTGKSSVGRG